MQAMYVSTLQILEKRFKAEEARAIAEAIEHEVNPVKFVTNDTLRLHLGELEARITVELTKLENRLFNKMIALGLTGAGLMMSVFLFRK